MKFRKVPFSRRQFLHYSTVSLGSVYLASARRAAAGSAPPRTSANDRLNIGLVGVAGQGRFHLSECLGENIVALCDVDGPSLDAAGREFPRASRHSDFRRMLDRERLDAVLIATPDHTHAVASVFALQKGCHVFCADPLTHRISEARAVARAARRHGRATQMGGSLCAPALEHRVVEWIRGGRLGPISEVHAWTDRSHGELVNAAAPAAPPPGLDYDVWLGPSFPLPYRRDYLPARWRHWWHFGGGTLSDVGCSHVSLAHRALGLSAPIQVQTWGPAIHLENTPAWLIVRSLYPGPKKDSPPVSLTWYHGGEKPGRFAEEAIRDCPEGLLFVGGAGKLLVEEHQARLLVEGEAAQSLAVDPGLASATRLSEWIDACRTGAPTTGNFESAAAVTEAVLLGNVSYLTDRKLVWDSRKMAATNLPEASEYIQHSYRPGWLI